MKIWVLKKKKNERKKGRFLFRKWLLKPSRKRLSWLKEEKSWNKIFMSVRTVVFRKKLCCRRLSMLRFWWKVMSLMYLENRGKIYPVFIWTHRYLPWVAVTVRGSQMLIDRLQKLKKHGVKIMYLVMKMMKGERWGRLKQKESSKKITGKGKQDRRVVVSQQQ